MEYLFGIYRERTYVRSNLKDESLLVLNTRCFLRSSFWREKSRREYIWISNVTGCFRRVECSSIWPRDRSRPWITMNYEYTCWNSRRSRKISSHKQNPLAIAKYHLYDSNTLASSIVNSFWNWTELCPIVSLSLVTLKFHWWHRDLSRETEKLLVTL
jgi:hypothetical protein